MVDCENDSITFVGVSNVVIEACVRIAVGSWKSNTSIICTKCNVVVHSNVVANICKFINTNQQSSSWSENAVGKFLDSGINMSEHVSLKVDVV